MERFLTIFGDILNSIWFKIAVILVILFFVYKILKSIYRKLCAKLINYITFERSFSEIGVYEGESVILTEIIHNTTPFPLFYVDVEEYIYNELRLVHSAFNPNEGMQLYISRFKLLLPHMQVKRRHEVKCLARGHYKLESGKILVSNLEKFVDSKAEIYVFPSMLEPATHPMPISMMQGDIHSNMWLMRDPFSISGIRDYTFGDPFNSINFKATAKSGGFSTGNLKVNNKDFCSNRTIFIYINFTGDFNNPIPGIWYEKIMKDYLEYATYILRDAAYKGYKFGLCANCKMEDGESFINFPVYSGNIQLNDILKALACVRLAPGVSFGGLINSHVNSGLSNSEIYVFTLYEDEVITNSLQKLKVMGNSINVVIANEDIENAKKES